MLVVMDIMDNWVFNQKLIMYCISLVFYSQFSPTLIHSLSEYSIIQIACGETFTLFLAKENHLFLTGMLECIEDSFMNLRAELAIPHEIAFDEEILKIAAGTRFALVLLFFLFFLSSRFFHHHIINRMNIMFISGKQMKVVKYLYQ